MRKYIKQIGIIMSAVLIAVGFLNLDNIASAVVPGVNQRVSLRSTGAQATLGSGQPFISANGKMVAFMSSASNIMPTGGAGIFARNLETGTIVRVSASTAGVVSNNTNYENVQKISATGRYIVFRSQASNLIDGRTISTTADQLYLRDTATSTTALVTQSLSGTMSNGTFNEAIGVSSDGRFVAFTSNASNLHPDSTNGSHHLYMLDRADASLSILDRKVDGTVGTTTPDWPPRGSMSCDGSLIAFQYPGAGGGNGLIAGDTTSRTSVYLLDRRGVSDKFTNLNLTGNYGASVPTISCNGDYVGFMTESTNLDPTVSVTYGYKIFRPYIYDRVNDTYHLGPISTSNASTNTAVCGAFANAAFPCIQLSDTGLGVFAATDSGLTGNSGAHIYIRDIHSGTTQLASKNSSGIAGDGNSGIPYITANGTTVVYSSTATNLVAGDTNNAIDVFTSLTGY
ncbi:MAG TPA: hypothetical protein VF281_03010 [Candidatus Saccharimonadales bacterium]